MKKIMIGAVMMAGLAGAISVLAESEAINPEKVSTRSVNAYGTNPYQVNGTNGVSAVVTNALIGSTNTMTFVKGILVSVTRVP